MKRRKKQIDNYRKRFKLFLDRTIVRVSQT